MNSGPEVRLLNRGAGGRESCMDTGTLPIVRPGFLKKWTFYFSSHPPERRGGGWADVAEAPNSPPLAAAPQLQIPAGLGGGESQKRAEQGFPSVG